MKLFAAAVVVALAVVFAWQRLGGSDSSSERALVARVIDGDTIVLLGGKHVRLVQIDTPEKGEECYGDAAGEVTRRLLPAGTRVRIETDPGLDRVDRYGRELAYVFKGDENVNLELVREGAAGPWFFGGRRGRYADRFLAAGEEARTKRRGLWAACPLASFDPVESLSSGPAR